MSRTFRLKDPQIKTIIPDRFIAMVATVWYSKDEEHKSQRGRVSVQVSVEFMTIAGDQKKVESLLCYYAIEKLKRILAAPDPILEHEFEPSEDEYKELLTIKPRVIQQAGHWAQISRDIEIDDVLPPQFKKIFISCGQYHENEKEAGKEIKQIIDSKKGFEGYFAENQQSFDGLTTNIFNALHDSIAFIAVMHRRDPISKNRYRGSVWIEQEIAIAAFMKQTLNVPIEVLAYIQDGIDLEGVRGLIILNPRRFTTDEDLISSIRASLPEFLEKITTQTR